MFLDDQGIVIKSPKQALVEAFRYGLIKDDDTFIDMLDDRNKTSHIYSEEMSREIFDRINKKYLSAIKNLVNEISKAIN